MNIIFFILVFILSIIISGKILKINKILNFFLINFFINIIVFSKLNYQNDYVFFIDLLLLFSLNLFFVWFYFTFVDGFSSKLLILISRDKKIDKIINRFITKNKKNKIIIDRIKYLTKGNYIKIKKNEIYLQKKIIPIMFIHNLVSDILRINKSGGIEN
jgi:hypothetical protein